MNQAAIQLRVLRQQIGSPLDCLTSVIIIKFRKAQSPVVSNTRTEVKVSEPLGTSNAAPQGPELFTSVTTFGTLYKMLK